MSKNILYTILCLASSVVLNACQGSQDDPKKSSQLASSYNLKDVKPIPYDTPSKCPDAPNVPLDMKFNSIYTDRSEGVSIVDPAAKIRYQEQIVDIRTFEKKIVSWTSKIIQGNKDKNNFCIVEWMKDWAEQNALMSENINFQGESLRKWALATISSQYNLLNHYVALKSSDQKIITKWIDHMAMQVIDDYSKHTTRNSRNNNHMYWAAWGVMAAGVAVDNAYYYEWAKGKYKQAVSEIQQDGILPRELERKSKAFNYHIFAIAPLVMIAETAARNGDDLYDYNNGALHRLIKLITSEINNGQHYVTEKSGVEQNMERSVTSTSLAWAAPYLKRFESPTLKRIAQKNSPLTSSRLGGNMSNLYN